MNEAIQVDFEDKLKRLTFKAPFYLLDVMRSFPSRRFDPKSKKWKMPLTKQNVEFLKGLEHKYNFQYTPAALEAMMSLEALMKGPTYKQFPRNWFPVKVGDKEWNPLEHQWDMLDKGYGLSAYGLFAAMGTGKTFVTINQAMARHKYEGLKRLAIITLKNIGNTWKKEFKKYADPDKYTIFRVQSGDHAGLSRWMKSEPEKLHVLIVGVEGLGISEKYYDTVCGFWLQRDGPIMTVCDESSRIKNEKAIRTARSISLGSGGSDYRMILNGTPIGKGIQDLWSQYEFLDPNIIGSGDYWAFRTRYLVYGGYEDRQIIGYSNVEELMALIQPYTLEVNKSVLNLPPKVYKTISVEPTDEQKSLFRQIIKGKGDNPHIKVSNVLERDLRLQQVVGGFQPMTTQIEVRHYGERTENEMREQTITVPLDENPKFDALINLIDENKEGSKFIIWSRFIPELEMIIAKLEELYGPESLVKYYGAVSDEDRAAAEDRYCNDRKTRFFVGNPAAAGLGLTLISGENDVMVYYSGTFAYIDRAQSEDRAHRIGQKNTCLIVDLVMDATIDTTIQASIAEKTDLDAYVKRKMAEGKTIEQLLAGEIE